MKLIEIYKAIVTESIYGRNVTVYHRTREKDLINNIYINGFKPGSGQLYGKGFYATYNLKSQLDYAMDKKYGNIIVKFHVTIDNFLIFNFDEFKKSPIGRKLKYNKYDFIFKQLDYFKLEYNKEYLKDVIDRSNYSSEIAIYCLNNISKLIDNVDGLIFTGENDGDVVVCYTPNKLIIPISYSEDNGKTWNKTEYDLNYFKRIFKYRNGKNVNGIKDFRDGLTLQTLKSKYPWVLNAEIQEAILGQDNYGLVWYSGIWKNGVWESGVWHNGTWDNGTWLGGGWLGGTWYNGTWLGGTWYNGTWLDKRNTKPKEIAVKIK